MVHVASLFLIPVIIAAIALFRSKFVRVVAKPTSPQPLPKSAVQQIQKRVVLEGALPISAMVLVGVLLVPWLVDLSPFALESPLDRIVFTLRFHAPCLLVFLWLFSKIFSHRFNCPQAINHQQCTHLDFEYSKRHLQNTLEQYVYCLGSHLVLTTYLKANQMAVIPFFICLWLAGRIFFFIEYDGLGEHTGTWGRILGFLMTFIPTTLAVACSLSGFISYLINPANPRCYFPP